MSPTLVTAVLALSWGQLPPAPQGQMPYGGGGTPYGAGVVASAGNSTQAFNTGDPTYPYDAPEPWVHGHWQEIPSYGGYHFFRPYNYKHVLSQSQVAGGWGMSPQQPISHDYFRRLYMTPVYDFRPHRNEREEREMGRGYDGPRERYNPADEDRYRDSRYERPQTDDDAQPLAPVIYEGRGPQFAPQYVLPR